MTAIERETPMNRTVEIDTVWTGGTVGCFAHGATASGRVALYAGTVAGVLVSHDAGAAWEPAAAGPRFVETLALSPRFAAGATVYAGGVEGLFVTRDGGKRWERLLDAHVHAVVAFEGIILAGTDRDGVVRSENGGRTWQPANPGLLDTTVLSLTVSPSAPSRVVVAGTVSGIYLSRNDGKAWRMAATPVAETAVAGFAVSPAWPGDHSAYAAAEGAGLWRSTDRGITWTLIPVLANAEVTAVAAGQDTRTPILAAATGRAVLLSRDRGTTWDTVGETVGEIAALHLLDATTLLAGQYDLGIARLTLR